MAEHTVGGELFARPGLATDRIRVDPRFCEALAMVRQNSCGRIWLFGSFLYGTLLGSSGPFKDLDFIVESLSPQLILPEGWIGVVNSYGNPKLHRDGLVVDLIPLTNIHSIKRRGLKPTIKNWLTGTPYTIQSIAYSVDDANLVGEIGLAAIASRTISVNNREQAEYNQDLYGIATGDKLLELSQKYDLKIT